MLRSIYFWSVVTVITVLYFPVVALSLPFNRGGKVIRFHVNTWGRLCLFASGVKLRITGIENIIQGRPQIFMSNHQSMHDIFALSVLPVSFKWLAKKELFKVPILGCLMYMVGSVRVDRYNPQKAKKGIDAAQSKIQSGTSIMIFPEGTRSYDGRLQPFKKGGFLLALKKKIPLVPITIKGSNKIMKKGTMKVHPGDIDIIINEPIETENLRVKDRKDLVQKVYDIMSRNLGEGV
ncbi:MAG: lysophospholipid acyltransferase family protein [Thermodesulfobacteriota bacterium]|nr:lysophospholipid acyltransferase family protein [Thermodesulfobacteriota bacterium]